MKYGFGEKAAICERSIAENARIFEMTLCLDQLQMSLK